jgi:hypothetical protein
MALELGPADASWNSVSLGKTNGGIMVKITDDATDLHSDQYGTSAEDTVITGTLVEVTLSLAEITMARLQSILQPQAATSSTAAVAGLNKVGTSLLGIAEELELTKYVNGVPSTDAKDKIIFPKAAPIGEVELSYDASNQRVLNAKFKCFFGTVNSKTCSYYFGDETATFS